MSLTPQIGKGKHSRACPALNAFISPADCGAQRGSKLACPATCPFYPFGTAGSDLWLRVDGNWTAKAVQRLIERFGRAAFQQRLRRFAVPMPGEEPALESALANAINFSLFVERQEDGRTLAEVWLAGGAPDLNNDERVMLEHRQHTRPAIIEVQEILDDRTARGIDLLAPERGEFILLDRAAAAQLVRFSRMLTWLTHYPHFSRANVFAMDIPHSIYRDWITELQSRTDAAAAGRTGYSVREYLAENLVPAVQLLRNLSDQYRRSLFARLDLSHCVASFLIKGDAAAVEGVLRSKPDFQADPPPEDSQFAPATAFYRWLAQGESAEFETSAAARSGPRLETSVGGAGALGNVRLYPERLLIETLSRSKHEFVRRKATEYLGPLVEFERESIVDLNEMIEERETRNQAVSEAQSAVYGGTRASTRLASETDSSGASRQDPTAEAAESQAKRLQELTAAHRDHYERFLEEAIPSLDGQSPRAAATDPTLRPRLVELMKSHVHGVERRCREDGLQLDLDWVLDILGLPELKLPRR